MFTKQKKAVKNVSAVPTAAPALPAVADAKAALRQKNAKLKNNKLKEMYHSGTSLF